MHRLRGVVTSRPAWFWALLAYLVVAFTVLAPTWADPGHQLTGGNDGYLFVWFLGWTPHALAHGLNPFVTHALAGGAPTNLMWNTAVPLLAIIAAPITVVFGPVITLITLATLAVVADGFVAYLVLRRWAAPVPAFIGGLFFGLCPFVIGGVEGHLHLAWAPLIWVMLALGDDLLIRGRAPVRCGILLGLTVAAQALVSEEVLLMAAIVAVLTVLLLVVLRPALALARWQRAVKGVGVAGGVAVALLAWPLTVQFTGPARLSGSFPNIARAVADSYGTFTPAIMQRFRPAWAMHIERHFRTNGSESSSYLGAPLIVGLLIITVWLRRNLLVLVSAVMVVLVTVLSLGAHLVAKGHLTKTPLPWRIVAHLPVLENVITVRFSAFVALFAAVLLAVGLTRLEALSWGRLSVPLAAFVLLVPLVPFHIPTFRFDTPAFFHSAADVRAAAAGRPVVVVPFPGPGDAKAMAWQAQAGYRFTMFGGYVAVPNANGHPQFGPHWNSLEGALVYVGLGRKTTWTGLELANWRANLADMAPGSIILGPTRHHDILITMIDQITGHDGVVIDGVDVWRTS